jgi:hypothetical protein
MSKPAIEPASHSDSAAEGAFGLDPGSIQLVEAASFVTQGTLPAHMQYGSDISGLFPPLPGSVGGQAELRGLDGGACPAIAINCNYPSLGMEASKPSELTAGGTSSTAGSHDCSIGTDPPKARCVNKGQAERHVQRMLDRIRAADDAGHRRAADHLTIEYLMSFDARYIAVMRAWKQMKKNYRPKYDLLPAIANRLHAWEGSAEDVILRLQAKKSNPQAFRSILNFGIENRALQYLVRSVLEVRAKPHADQYTFKGVHAAIQQVADLMADGYVWAIETDIRDCFPSFDGQKAPNHLPIPRRVSQHSLLGSSLQIILHPSQTLGSAELDEYMLGQELADARRGFPQGSAASSLAVESLLAPLFAQLPAAGALIGYADNFLAMAEKECEAVTMTTALWGALKAHPVGPLWPKQPKIFEPGKPIEFLGHSLQFHKGAVRIDPTPENCAEFEARLNKGLFRIRKATPEPACAKRLARRLKGYVMSWTAAFKLCTGMSSCRSHALKLSNWPRRDITLRQ